MGTWDIDLSHRNLRSMYEYFIILFLKSNINKI